MRRSWLAGLAWVLLAVRVEGQEPIPCCDPCEPPACERGWARAGYLHMWLSGQPLPPLVTTGPLDQLGPNNRPGTLGRPGTQIVMGGEDLDFGPFSGGQFSVGRWLGDGEVGVEVGGFFLGERSAGRSVSSDGSFPLSIPYFNAQLGQESSTGVALPPLPGEFTFSGGAALVVDSELWGIEANGVRSLSRRADRRFELLAGFRYLSLDESLQFDTTSTNVTPPFDIFQTRDRFQCSNDFYGGQVGVRGELGRGAWFVAGSAKVALGVSHQVTTTHGVLLTNDFNPQFGVGPPRPFPGGYLVLPSNIGRHAEDHFAVVPELEVRVGCWLTDRLRASVGWTVLYASSVARPGDQIDRVINPSQGPAYFINPNAVSPARPAFLDNTSDLWVNGLSGAIEFRY